MLYSILTFILILNLTLFYLDDFKLSSNRYLKLLQKLSPIILLTIGIILYNKYTIEYNNIFFISEDGKTPNLSTNTEDKPGNNAKGIEKASIASLGSTVAAFTGSVATVLAKSPLPPVRKAFFVMGSGFLGAATH